jgi:methionyl-tRNA synthetase
VSGSDEHGTPIEVEAARRRIEPKRLTDEVHERVVDLFSRFNISFDIYTRTHNPVHISFCQSFFKRVYDNGYIFESLVDQLYCERCGRFLPDRFVLGTCPNCGYASARGDQCESCGRVLDPLDLLGPVCAICGVTPVVKATRHWFFDLPRLTEPLKRWLASNSQMPERVRAFTMSWLEEGLRPRAVTRDNRWGIPAPFPGAGAKTIYVWLEAVLGYLSATVELGERLGRPGLWEEYWLDKDCRTIYFIGKDNIPFHTIILPALLLAHGDPFVLPWSVSATEYLTYEGQKFSKSKRVGVWLDEALEMLPADYWRYYLVKMRPETSDTSFRWQEFVATINSDLNDDIGNFVHRVLTFVYQFFGGRVPRPGELDEADRRLLDRVVETIRRVDSLMLEARERQALLEILALVREGNGYLNLKEPWKTYRTDSERAATTLYVSIQAVAALSMLLDIVTPDAASKLRGMVGRAGGVRGGLSGPVSVFLEGGAGIGRPEPLFRKVSEKELQEKREKLAAA